MKHVHTRAIVIHLDLISVVFPLQPDPTTATMATNRPSHIRLPPQPSPGDVFTRHTDSALDSAPTPSDASPAGSPSRRQPDEHALPKGKDPVYRDRARQSLGAHGGGDAYRARRMSKASTLARSVLLSPGIDEEDGKPAIPTLLPNIRPAYSTPLPVLPMVVLCIVSTSYVLLDAEMLMPM